MHSSILILIGYLIASIQGVIKYKCGKDLKIDDCQLKVKNGTDEIKYVKPCNKGEKCVLIEDMANYGSSYKCVKTSIFNSLKVGESCISSIQCESRVCHNGKCSYLEDYFAYCKNDYQCGLNSYCDKVCKPIKKKGEVCDGEEHCEIGTVCSKNDSKKICMERYSLMDGRITNDFDLCESGYGVRTISDEYKCATLKILDKTCDADHKCKFEVNSNEITFNCVQDNEGEYVCPERQASQAFKDYVKLYKEEVKKFNTKGVKITNVNREHFGNEKLLKAYVNYIHEANIKLNTKDENEKCLNEYWYQIESNAVTIRLSISLFLLSLLLLF